MNLTAFALGTSDLHSRPAATLLFALLCAGVAWLTRGTRTFKRTATQVTGKVVEVTTRLSSANTDGRRQTMYSPVVLWTDDHGKNHKLTPGLGVNDPNWVKVGDDIPVLYLPGRPETAKLSSQAETYARVGTVMWIFAAVLLGFAVFDFIR